jgi:hypothetical protein
MKEIEVADWFSCNYALIGRPALSLNDPTAIMMTSIRAIKLIYWSEEET